MIIDHLILGAYETNCYVLRDNETSKDCLIIDTGLEAGQLVKFLKRYKLSPAAVVLTHGHPDHVAGVAALYEKFPDIKVYIHKLDAEMLTSSLVPRPSSILFLEEESIIEQADIKLQVLHTPGHTPGGVCLYSKDEGLVFTDDVLFADSVGRTDLGGDMAQLIKSIRQKR